MSNEGRTDFPLWYFLVHICGVVAGIRHLCGMGTTAHLQSSGEVDWGQLGKAINEPANVQLAPVRVVVPDRRAFLGSLPSGTLCPQVC